MSKASASNANEVLCSPILQRIENQAASQILNATCMTPDNKVIKSTASPRGIGAENHAPPSNGSLSTTSYLTSSSSIEVVCQTLLSDSANQHNAMVKRVQNARDDLRVSGGKIEQLGIPVPATYADATNLAAQHPHIAERILALPLGKLTLDGSDSVESTQSERGQGEPALTIDEEMPQVSAKSNTSATDDASAHTESRPNWALAPDPASGEGRGKRTDGTEEKNVDEDRGGRSRRRRRGGGGRNKGAASNERGTSSSSRNAKSHPGSGSASTAASRAPTPGSHPLPVKPATEMRHPLPEKPQCPASAPVSTLGSRTGTPALFSAPVSAGVSRGATPFDASLHVPLPFVLPPALDMKTQMQLQVQREFKAEVDALIHELQVARYSGSVRVSGPEQTNCSNVEGAAVPQIQLGVGRGVMKPSVTVGTAFPRDTHTGSGTYATALNTNAIPAVTIDMAWPVHTNSIPCPSDQAIQSFPDPNTMSGTSSNSNPKSMPKHNPKWMRDRNGVLRPGLHLNTDAVRTELRVGLACTESQPSSPTSTSANEKAPSFYAQNIRAPPVVATNGTAGTAPVPVSDGVRDIMFASVPSGAMERLPAPMTMPMPVGAMDKFPAPALKPTPVGATERLPASAHKPTLGSTEKLPAPPVSPFRAPQLQPQPQTRTRTAEITLAPAVPVPERPRLITSTPGAVGAVGGAAATPADELPWPTLDEICAMKAMKLQKTA